MSFTRRTFIKKSSMAALIAANSSLLFGIAEGEYHYAPLNQRQCTIGACTIEDDVNGVIFAQCAIRCVENGVEVLSGHFECDLDGNPIDPQEFFGPRPPGLWCDPSFDDLTLPGGGGVA